MARKSLHLFDPRLLAVAAMSMVGCSASGDAPAGAPHPTDPGGTQLPSSSPPSSSSVPSGAPTTPGQVDPSGPGNADGSPTNAPSDESAAAAEQITISFAGDIHFEGALRPRLDDPDAALEPISPALSAADLAVVNLETSVGTGGTPAPKRYTFQAPPAAFDALAAAGIDVATMANNHALDFGQDGFAETLTAADQARVAKPPLAVVGIGSDTSEAFDPAILDVDGTRVAVLGASQPDDPGADPTAHWAAADDRPGIAVALDPEALLEAVETARSKADVVVVYMHWGTQGDSCPADSQTRLARSLADTGADIVVGSHAHRLQGSGMLDDTYVSYGLGNFAWYTQSPATAATGVLTLTVRDGQVIDDSWAPARIRGDGLPELTDGAAADEMANDLAELRECTNLKPLR